MEQIDILFFIFFSSFVLMIIWIIVLIIIQTKQYTKDGKSRCSVCGKSEPTMYYYYRNVVKYFHCNEHFNYDHRNKAKKTININ